MSSSIRITAVVVLVSVAIWSVYLVGIRVVLGAYPLDLPPWEAALLVLVFISVSVVIPASFGHLGVYEAACIFAFSLYGLDKAQGLAIGVLLHVPIYIVHMGTGIVCLLSEGLSLGAVRRETLPSSPGDTSANR